MELVIDSNCLISTLIRPAKSRELIFSQKICLFAPESIIMEAVNHKKDVLEKSGIMDAEFDQLIGILIANINVVPQDEFKHYEDRAKTLVTHDEDIPFIALALAKNIPYGLMIKICINSLW
ncbi:MAG: PIN domain-containing protein [Nanoarchaeota archaeon]